MVIKNKKNKILSLLTIICMLISMCSLGLTVSAQESTTYKFTENSDKVNICGRGVFKADGFYGDISASGLEFNLDCSGDVTLQMSWKSAVGMIGVIIDDNFDGINKIKIDVADSQNITIAELLTSGVHKFKIMKLSTYSTNTMILTSVTCNGTLMQKPAQKELKIELYGDSISCGVGALCPSIQSLSPNGYYDDASSSFGVNCANELNAEISVVAAPGYGYAYGYSTGESQILYDLYDRALFNDSSSKWDFSQYDADIVVFFLGTNDTNWVKGKRLITDTEEVRKKVYKYIDTVNTYNPDCDIVLIGGGTGFNQSDWANGPYLMLNDIMLDASDDYDNVHFLFSMNLGGSGGGWHPNAVEAKAGGKVLADYINDNILDPILYGDADDDGKVNAKDLLVIKKYIAKITYTINYKTANVNLDEKINAKDILLIKKHIVGIKVHLGQVTF